jgi:hypothetical protein
VAIQIVKKFRRVRSALALRQINKKRGFEKECCHEICGEDYNGRGPYGDADRSGAG